MMVIDRGQINRTLCSFFLNTRVIIRVGNKAGLW